VCARDPVRRGTSATGSLVRHGVRASFVGPPEAAPRQFLMGEYELAAFAAMKQVEVRVREMTGLPSEAVGVALMRKPFGDGGLLRTRCRWR
jgi:hypothetical protein